VPEPEAATIFPFAVTIEQGIAAAARSYADLTAVLEAIVVEEVVEVLSDSLLCREEETTASLESVPA
jgi:hypothetical protein